MFSQGVFYYWEGVYFSSRGGITLSSPLFLKQFSRRIFSGFVSYCFYFWVRRTERSRLFRNRFFCYLRRHIFNKPRRHNFTFSVFSQTSFSAYLSMFRELLTLFSECAGPKGRGFLGLFSWHILYIWLYSADFCRKLKPSFVPYDNNFECAGPEGRGYIELFVPYLMFHSIVFGWLLSQAETFVCELL